MSDFSVLKETYPSCSYKPCANNRGSQHESPAQNQPTTHAEPSLPTPESTAGLLMPPQLPPASKAEKARESRNKAEKQRRDKMNQSISLLASIVPPVATAGKKVDKTSVLRYAAHYLRSHRHVFGRSIRCGQSFSPDFIQSVLRTLGGFLLTTTYKGLVVVVSPNVQDYLGYTEGTVVIARTSHSFDHCAGRSAHSSSFCTQLELLGQNLYSIIHQEDHQLLSQQLFPRSCKLTTNGELFLSNEPDSAEKAAAALKNEKRSFLVRFKKISHQRSEPAKYITCQVEGSFRKSDCAGVYVDNRVQVGRRVRSRSNNPYASGNDIVFIGVVRPITETFKSESRIESFRMEYRTRHSIDGRIIQCEQRICLITGYMIDEVTGVNAMNFMHRDDVRWVVVALREMYINHRLIGESSYRLMTKNGKFLHMRTTGALDVDPNSKEATSFVCTNTVVPEEEGKELIKQMKKKLSFQIINEEPKDEKLNEDGDDDENQHLPIEDPRQLEQVIYHLVTDLPSPRPEEARENHETSITELAIIPPKREQIKEAIEKSYKVLKTLRQTDPTNNLDKMCTEKSASDTEQNSNSVYTFGDDETNLEVTQAPATRNENVQYDYFLPHSSFTSNYNPNQPNHEEVDPHKINQLVQCQQSTAELHLNMGKDSEDNDEIPKGYNYLDSPSSFCDVFDLVTSNNIESGMETWNSVQPSFVKLPEDSSIDYMDTNNFSFVNMDMLNLPDLDISLEEMDSLIDAALNDSNLFDRAAQASHILNETNIDDIQASEIECHEMESQLTKIETEQNQEFCFVRNFEISQNTEQDTAASNIHEQNNPQLPVKPIESYVDKFMETQEWEERQEFFCEEAFEISQNTEEILMGYNNPVQNNPQVPVNPIKSTGNEFNESHKFEERREFFYKESFEISQNTKKIVTANNNTSEQNNPQLLVKPIESTMNEFTELHECEERREFSYEKRFEISQNTEKIIKANNSTPEQNNPQLLGEFNESFGNCVVYNDPYEFHSDDELSIVPLRRKPSGK